MNKTIVVLICFLMASTAWSMSFTEVIKVVRVTENSTWTEMTLEDHNGGQHYLLCRQSYGQEKSIIILNQQDNDLSNDYTLGLDSFDDCRKAQEIFRKASSDRPVFLEFDSETRRVTALKYFF